MLEDLISRILLPRRVHDLLLAGAERESFEAVGLFVDLSGFTAMSERLMARGQHEQILAGWVGIGEEEEVWAGLSPRSRPPRLQASLPGVDRRRPE
jgi:hypothetical protein